MKSMFKFLALILFVASMLTACGGGGSGGGGGDNGGQAGTSNAVADAGSDQDVNIGDVVDLDGTGSHDPDNQLLSYTWLQVYGPDVTGGSGELTGATPSFIAPDVVSTVEFDLVVDDGTGNSTPDRVQINVMEDRLAAVFVDGTNGSDENGDGSRANPYASIGWSLFIASVDNKDLYVMSKPGGAGYDQVSVISIAFSNSLYGGFDSNWVRDVDNNRTVITSLATGIEVDPRSSSSVTISGFDITVAAANVPGSRTVVIKSVEASNLTVRDNTLIAEAAPTGTTTAPGFSFGIYANMSNMITILNNTISAGRGGDGADGDNGAAGTPGGAAFGQVGGSNSPYTELHGFSGGNGGNSSNGCNGQPGGGPGGPGTDATEAGEHALAAGAGYLDLNSGFVASANGASGTSGQDGTPGSGGHGSNGTEFTPPFGDPVCVISGLPGGGGGAAASHGIGGSGGGGGGASIGVFVSLATEVQINGNTISASDGGNAGSGGTGGPGAEGGAGQPVIPLSLASAGYRGGNSTGGGDGAGGGGGMSAAILLGPGISDGLIADNTLTNGNGGTGGDSRHGGAGDGGWSYLIMDWNCGIGGIPYSNNVVNDQGTAGVAGTASGSGTDGSAGQNGFRYIFAMSC